MIELIENIDLSFPFDEKFYFYNSEKNIVYYKYNNFHETIFFVAMCNSLIKEGKNVLFITGNKSYEIFLKNNYAKFFNSKNGELFFMSKNITNNNLKKFLNKNIDCIIIENISECKINTQIPKMLFEFNIDEDEFLKLDFLKNKILQTIEFLNIPFIILGNSHNNPYLNIEIFDYAFEIQTISVVPDFFINYNINKLNIKIKDLKNRYSQEIYHKPISISFNNNGVINII